MFQAYRIKLQKTICTGVRSYTYRNCTISVSRADGKLIVSIAPHGNPVLPDKEEMDGIS